jgi:hypothetical protein
LTSFPLSSLSAFKASTCDSILVIHHISGFSVCLSLVPHLFRSQLAGNVPGSVQVPISPLLAAVDMSHVQTEIAIYASIAILISWFAYRFGAPIAAVTLDFY